MWAKAKTWLLGLTVSAAVALGCGAVSQNLPPPLATDGVTVYGAHVYYNPEALHPMSEAVLKRAFETAAQYWGVKPEATTGWVYIQRGNDAWQVAGTWVWGITFVDLKRVDFATPRPDCPELVFVHEFGHSGGGQVDHTDPRMADDAIHSFLVGAGICPAVQ